MIRWASGASRVHGVQVPVEAVVAHQPGERPSPTQQVVDHLHRIVAIGGEQGAQLRPEAAYGVQLGGVAVPAAGVLEARVVGVEVLDSRQGVRILAGVHQRDRGLERHLGVMCEQHVDRLHDVDVVSYVMSTVADDKVRDDPGPPGPVSGLGFALLSAATFGMSGALAGGLLVTGWTPGAVVLARITIAALVVLPFGLRALRGRWHLLRAGWRTVLVYGLVAVAATQFFYFSAVAHMEVGPALLIEYTAPAAIVLWLWLRHGERPSPVTLAGAGVAGLGLVLVLDLVSGAELSLVGVGWALAAMVGCAIYFVLSADEGNGLPPIALAASGHGHRSGVPRAAWRRSACSRWAAPRPSVMLAGRTVDWWVPVLLLGVVTAAVAYVAGIAASRRLGSRLASFVALVEVVFGVLWAWVLLDELPRVIQLVGGVLILAGVVAVKLGERSVVVVRRRGPRIDGVTEELRVVPANHATWEDLQQIFGTRGAAYRCQCQRYKLAPKESFGSVPVEDRAFRLRRQTDCGHPDSGETSGLVAYLGDEPVGWCAVEPRPAYVGLTRVFRVPVGRPRRGPDRRDGVGGDVSVHPGGVPQARRQPCAGGAAVDHARAGGARALEAYPINTTDGHPGRTERRDGRHLRRRRPDRGEPADAASGRDADRLAPPR